MGFTGINLPLILATVLESFAKFSISQNEGNF
jgi:hypothetical protein